MTKMIPSLSKLIGRLVVCPYCEWHRYVFYHDKESKQFVCSCVLCEGQWRETIEGQETENV